MSTSIKKIREIAHNVYWKYGGEYWNVGIRVQDSDYGQSVGETINHVSRVWDDGNQTDELLDGVSVIDAFILTNHPEGRFDYITAYDGDVILILGYDDGHGGEDYCEVVAKDAVILEIIK